MLTPLLRLAITTLLAGSVVQAQEIVDPFEEPEEWDLFAAEEKLVTVASRYQQTAREAPAVVEVIDSTEIRSMGYRTLADVLQSLPGVFLSQSPEGYQLAWFRGVIQADNNKLLLLVDGAPIYDGFYSHAWIDAYLPLDRVKQIEIIKGPGSAIYGTNAFAGVVNVVTRSATEIQGVQARIGGGSFGTRELSVTSGDRLGKGLYDGQWTAYARIFESLGDGIERTPKGERDVQGQRPISSTNVGFGVSVGALNIRYDHVSYVASYLTQAESNIWEVLLESPDEFNLGFRNDFLYASYDWHLGDETHIRPWLLFQDHDNPGLYGWLQEPELVVDDAEEIAATEWAGTLVETEKHTRRYGTGVHFEARPSYSHVVVAGAGAEAIEVVRVEDRYFIDFSPTPESPSPFSVPPGSWVGGVHAFAQHTWTPLYWVKLNTGARIDYNSTTDTLFPSPRIGFLMVPHSRLSSKLLYGRAFRAPSVRELLVEVATEEDGSYKFTASNSALQPETIDTVEGELRWSPTDWLESRFVAFGSLLGNAISKSDDPNQYINRGGATVAGGEFEAHLKLGNFSSKAAYAYLWGRDTETGFPIYGYPPHMGHLRGSYRIHGQLQLNAELSAYSAQPRTDWAPDSKAPDGTPYWVANLGVSTASLGDGRVQFDASVRNVFNTASPSLVYVERANALDSDGRRKYTQDIEREGRFFRVNMDIRF